ncbi:MAG: sensor histidine kinase [Pseudonocardiaceae bacterium]
MTEHRPQPTVAVTVAGRPQRTIPLPAAELARPFRRPVTEAATSPDRDDPPTPPDGGRRLPARVLIMGWVMLLMFGVLVVVNLATRQALLSDVEEQVARALQQESDEFTTFAGVGVDPETSEQFSDVRTLYETHLQRQTPDDDEILFGFVDETPGATVPTGRVRQFDEPPYDVSADVELRRKILDSPFGTGSIGTPAGELRWQKVRTLAPGGVNPAGWFVTGYFVDRDRAEVADTMRTLAVVSLVGLVIAGIGAWLVSGQILAPVRLVRQTAAEITEKDLTRRIPVQGRDDISQLTEQFNAMLDRLQDAFSVQRQFVDDASHELRTPITIVRGHLELMDVDSGDPAERAEVVRLVTDELDRMSRIVEDLLLLAKSQRPDFVRPERISVAELTSDVDAKVRALGERRWVLEAIGEGTADLDPQRVTQAMVQLAQNAVQHTTVGDEIRLGSVLHDAAVSFWVSDTGPGVRPEDAEAIFERFSRGATGGARTHRTGAGLGLAIVRAIADAHRGSVRLVSDPGEGATFGIELPARAREEKRP